MSLKKQSVSEIKVTLKQFLIKSKLKKYLVK